MKPLRNGLLGLLLAASAPLWAARPDAPYPTRAITIVVPFAAGGSTDLLARVIAQGLGESLKQTVIVENRPGAGSVMGTAQVAKAPADGYTLVLGTSSLTSNAAVNTKMPFDVGKDLAPIAVLAKGPFMVVVNDKFPARTPREFIAELKRHPGKYAYASGGIGSTNHLAAEMIFAMAGTSAVHVPYRGATPALTDLVSDQVQFTLSTGPSLLQHLRGGRVRAIAITSARASPVAPDLLPVATAVAGYEFEQWWGLLAAAGTPAAIVQRLNAEVNKIVATPAFKHIMLREGALAQSGSPAQFAAIIAAEIPRWQQLARQQKIKLE